MARISSDPWELADDLYGGSGSDDDFYSNGSPISSGMRSDGSTTYYAPPSSGGSYSSNADLGLSGFTPSVYSSSSGSSGISVRGGTKSSSLGNRSSGLKTAYSYKRSPTGSTTTTKTAYAGAAPTYPNLPAYTAPEWDEGEVSSLTQKYSATGRRSLRRAVQEAYGRNYGNPNVRRMTLREALKGYGEGLGSVMSAAARQATNEYGARYAGDVSEATINYQTQMQQAQGAFQAAWNQWLASAEKTSTTEYTYG